MKKETALYHLYLLGPHWEESKSYFPVPETRLTEMFVFFASFWSVSMISLIGA